MTTRPRPAPPAASRPEPAPATDGPLLALLVFDAVLLAVFELFFLPLRFDGTLLPDLGGAPFPITVLVAAVTQPWLVRRAGDASPRLVAAGAPLWAWLAVIAVFGLLSSGETMLLVPDWRALLLVAAGALPAAAALGRVLAGERQRRNETGAAPP